MEAWMPGRGSWGEISSTSNCTDYQARRLHIRHRPTGETSSIPFAHTLNGTAAAIPRLIVTILENNARFSADGQLEGLDLPKVLQPFWPGSLDGTRFRWTS
jgi:seryl-tRNA synthetase